MVVALPSQRCFIAFLPVWIVLFLKLRMLFQSNGTAYYLISFFIWWCLSILRLQLQVPLSSTCLSDCFYTVEKLCPGAHYQDCCCLYCISLYALAKFLVWLLTPWFAYLNLCVCLHCRAVNLWCIGGRIWFTRKRHMRALCFLLSGCLLQIQVHAQVRYICLFLCPPVRLKLNLVGLYNILWYLAISWE